MMYTTPKLYFAFLRAAHSAPRSHCTKEARSTDMRPNSVREAHVARSVGEGWRRRAQNDVTVCACQLRGACKNNAEVCVAGEGGGSGGSEDAPKDPTVCVAAVNSSIASRASQPRTHGMDNFTHLSADTKHREGGKLKVIMTMRAA
jgi:hypothetical protein